ncbi:MAG: MAPEG family protein [Deltaproteobacteria bacterium]
MTLIQTAPYAAVLTLIFITLNLLAITRRSKTTISLGDRGDDLLLEASRRQMNFVENVPLALLLMVIAESGGASAMILNGAGLTLVVARLIHPFGITVTRQTHPLRIIGSVATTAVQLVMAVTILAQTFA